MSTEDIYQHLFSLMGAQLAHVQSTFAEVAAMRTEAYNFPPKPDLFLQAADRAEAVQAQARQMEVLISVLNYLLDSDRLHDTGESSFFSEEYEDAEGYFQEAEGKLRQCLAIYERAMANNDIPWSLNDLLRALIIYYQVQAVESHAFLSQRDQDWRATQLYHEQEIELSESGKQLAEDILPTLSNWFDGHIWYTRKRQYESLATQCDQRGETTSRDEYLEKAREANLKSNNANAQYTGYE